MKTHTKNEVIITQSMRARRRQLSTVELARLANTEATRGVGEYDHKQIAGTGYLPPAQVEAGAKWGVGVRTIQRVRAIDESGEEDLKEALTIRGPEKAATGSEPFSSGSIYRRGGIAHHSAPATASATSCPHAASAGVSLRRLPSAVTAK